MTIFFTRAVKSQGFADQASHMHRHTQSEVLDSTGSITIYNKLIDVLSGDSVKFNKEGYHVQGWNEDFYASGKLLHKGYYKDGKLVLFKNFFENGQCERNMTMTDPLHCDIDVFYDSGIMKNKISYYNGITKNVSEFYPDGLQKSVVEYGKDMKYLVSKKVWYANGNIQLELKLIDAKTKKYSEKYYYPNGQVKEEGGRIFSSENKQYLKSGVWFSYDTSGKNKRSEKFNIKSNSN